MANNNKLNKIQIAPSELIFEFVTINLFKEMGNKILENLTVALLPKVTKLTKGKEIENVLKKYHDDPIEGGHYGVTKTLNKIKRHFYWPNITKDINNNVMWEMSKIQKYLYKL